MCYSYDGIEQLQDLCDYENSFTLEDAIGTCFWDLTLQIDSLQTEIQPLALELGIDPLIEVANLASFTNLLTDESLNCGEISYMLEDQTQDAFIQVDSQGIVYVDPLSPDPSLYEGLHEVNFLVYLSDIDIEARNQISLGITLFVQLNLPELGDNEDFVAEISTSLI